MIKVKRIPNDSTYNIFFTLVMAFTILTVVYALTPNKHCSVYFTKKVVNL
jgi:hypothetical protein